MVSESRKKASKNYYDANKAEILRKRRERYKTDPLFRKKILDRGRNRRAVRLSNCVFDTSIHEDLDKIGAEKLKYATPDRVILTLYDIDTCAKIVKRSVRTLHSWLKEGVLPGPSAIISRRSYFTHEYMVAMRKALLRLSRSYQGRNKNTLREFVMHEFRKAEITYVPRGGTEEERVVLRR